MATPLALSASTTSRAGPFARTCQAGHLLGRVIEHVNDRRMPAEFRYDEAMTLDRSLRALSSLLPDEAETDERGPSPTLCVGLSICYSAMLTLYDAYSCPDSIPEGAPEAHLVVQKFSIEGLAVVSDKVLSLAQSARSYIDIWEPDKLSPFTLDCFYQAAANCKSLLLDMVLLNPLLTKHSRLASERAWDFQRRCSQ